MKEIIQFPSNIETEHSAYIMLTGQQWGTEYKEDKTAQQISLENYISITLPMPTNGLVDSTSHEWNQTEGALLNLSRSNVGKMITKGIAEQVKQSFGNMMAAQQFVSGKTINDFAALTYGGQGFRQFDFEFDLIPNNAQDAKKLNDIIRLLKIGSLPKNTGAILGYPYFWIIQALKPNGEKYFDIQKSVISNLAINRFQDGDATIHQDGEPIKTNISVSFSEIEREWQDDY